LTTGVNDTRAQELLDDIAAGKKIKPKQLEKPAEAVSAPSNRHVIAVRLAFVAVVFVAVIAIILLRPKPSVREPEMGPLTADARELNFSYRLGDAEPAAQTVHIQPGSVPFDAFAEDDWLRVTPVSGGGLVAQVDTKKVGQGIYTTEVRVRAQGPASNPTLLIPVHLKVEGKPATQPIPLVLNPSGPLTFDYTIGQLPPPPQSVMVTQGEIGEIRPSSLFPLNWERREKMILLSIARAGISEGSHEGILSVRSPDSRVAPVELVVRLVVHPAPKPLEINPPKSKAEPEISKAEPPPQPLGPGCSPRPYAGNVFDKFEWQGRLESGGRLTIMEGTPGLTGQLPPQGHPLDITITSPAAVAIGVEPPTFANNCKPLVLINRTAFLITSISVGWTVNDNRNDSLRADSRLEVPPKPDVRKEEPVNQELLKQEAARQAREALVRKQIFDTLAVLNLAFARNKPRDVKQIWPGIDQAFLSAMATPRTKMSLDLKDIRLAPQADQANVICDLIINNNGATTVQRAMLMVQNAGGRWKIESTKVN
jgi:hypothetical protein